MSAARFHSFLRAAAALMLAVALVTVAFGWTHPSVRIPLTFVLVDGASFAVEGAIVALLAAWWFMRPSPAAITGFVLQTMLLLSLIVVQGGPQRGMREVTFVSSSKSPERLWVTSVDWNEPQTEPHPRLGYHNLPNVKTRQHHRDFDVVYTHGPDGFRVMPEPSKSPPAGGIVFLGCSMTFGIGCKDDQTYPWLLAKYAWPEYRVLNWSVSGWGTNQAAIALDDALRRDPKPAAIIYSIIGHHLERNYLRQSWFKSQTVSIPLFDEQGNLKKQVPGPEAKAPDSPETSEREIRITQAILRRMKEKCDAADVPFVVLLLQRFDRYGRDIKNVVEPTGVPWLDLSDAFSEIYPNDFHLTPLGQARMARAIASQKQLAESVDRPDLYQPTAFPDIFPGEDFFRFKFATDDDPQQHRTAQINADEKNVEVRAIQSFSHEPSQARVARLLSRAEEGDFICLSFEATSEESRSLQWLVESWTERPEILSPTIPFKTNEGTSRYVGRTLHSSSSPRLVFEFGGDDTSFSIRNVSASVSKLIPEGFSWLVTFPTEEIGSYARLTQIDSSERKVRIDGVRSKTQEGWTVQYRQAALPVERGEEYSVSIRWKSDRPRVVDMGLYDTAEPSRLISDFRRFEVTEEWKEDSFQVAIKESASPAVMGVLLGQDETPVEIAGASMTKIDRPNP